MSRQEIFSSAGRASSLPSSDEDLRMMAVSWSSSDERPRAAEEGQEEDTDANEYAPRQFVVRLYGVTATGASVCATLTGFLPTFYVRVEEAWGPRAGGRLRDCLAQASGKGWSVASCELMRRKDYQGFHNGESREFVAVRFSQHFAMRQLSKRLMDGMSWKTDSSGSARTLDLTPIMIPHRGRLSVYESNIDPLLRLMHLRGVSPAGWVCVHRGRWSTSDGSTCQLDAECNWTDLHPVDTPLIAPILVLSFDIECGSSHGDFPQAKKGLEKLGMELTQAYTHAGIKSQSVAQQEVAVTSCLQRAFGLAFVASRMNSLVSRVFPKAMRPLPEGALHSLGRRLLEEMRTEGVRGKKTAIMRVTEVLAAFVRSSSSAGGSLPTHTRVWGAAEPHPPGLLEGDPIIQVGVAMHLYGDAKCCQRHVLTLGSCEAIDCVQVHTYEDEASLLLGFAELVVKSDPDALIGYNQFGFDWEYLNGRSEELGVSRQFSAMGRVGRGAGRACTFRRQTLSSSALGDNELRYFDITGRCQIDLMKLVQREHKLDSYRLDAVADHFLGMRKNDISPQDIFRLQLGTAADRRVIAQYCVQDCELCNHLLMKLEVVANYVGMANVCCVPLSFLILRGQGIKVLSLVARRCLAEGFLIPTIARVETEDEEGEGYEGAIVLEPATGLYLDEPVSVLDFASLYPSSMISGNLSHDTFVMEERYDNLPGVEYTEVRYDTQDGLRQEVCRFARTTTGILPMILEDLLSARKSTRARIKALEKEGAERFLLAVLDGQQVAFKVTANSLYGQMGARTSALYLKQIAACTTAIGRQMILKAKAFLEDEHGARVIYGDTDSVFAVFPNRDPLTGVALRGRAALQASIDEGMRASAAFRANLPTPHDLEYEKTFLPFFLLSKKRYVGKRFERSADGPSEVSSMGLVTKRRDNAPIVKTIYGGIIDILLDRQDVHEAETFLRLKLMELVEGKVTLEELVVSKALKGFYKAPDTIAHYVLARRMGERDPGSKPQVNDRVPYVYIVAPRALLQGERIETPGYVRSHGLAVDTTHYVTNQIMKPVVQLLSLALESLSGYRADLRCLPVDREAATQRLLFDTVLNTSPVRALEKKRQRMTANRTNVKNGQRELTDFFVITS